MHEDIKEQKFPTWMFLTIELSLVGAMSVVMLWWWYLE